jgi:hypothetical protein
MNRSKEMNILRNYNGKFSTGIKWEFKILYEEGNWLVWWMNKNWCNDLIGTWEVVRPNQ